MEKQTKFDLSVFSIFHTFKLNYLKSVISLKTDRDKDNMNFKSVFIDNDSCE